MIKIALMSLAVAAGLALTSVAAAARPLTQLEQAMVQKLLVDSGYSKWGVIEFQDDQRYILIRDAVNFGGKKQNVRLVPSGYRIDFAPSR